MLLSCVRDFQSAKPVQSPVLEAASSETHRISPPQRAPAKSTCNTMQGLTNDMTLLQNYRTAIERMEEGLENTLNKFQVNSALSPPEMVLSTIPSAAKRCGPEGAPQHNAREGAPVEQHKVDEKCRNVPVSEAAADLRSSGQKCPSRADDCNVARGVTWSPARPFSSSTSASIVDAVDSPLTGRDSSTSSDSSDPRLGALTENCVSLSSSRDILPSSGRDAIVGGRLQAARLTPPVGDRRDAITDDCIPNAQLPANAEHARQSMQYQPSLMCDPTRAAAAAATAFLYNQYNQLALQQQFQILRQRQQQMLESGCRLALAMPTADASSSVPFHWPPSSSTPRSAGSHMITSDVDALMNGDFQSR
jgi:hypothetical protein